MRRARVAVELLLAIAIFAGVNWLAARHYRRGDWTRGATFTLSEKTQNVLASLKQKVEVIVFMLPNGEEANDLYGDVRELLERARRVTDKLEITYVDVDREPERLRTVGKKYGISGDDLVSGVIVVDAGTQSKFITRDELAEYDWANAEEGRPPPMKAWKGEQALAAALLAVTEERAPMICFTQGHGEPAIDSFEPGEYGDFAEELKRDHYQVRGFEPAAGVPRECDLTVVAGPEQPFGKDEQAALEALLQRGGRLLALVGPSFDPQVTKFERTGLEDLLERWGADLRDDLVVDVPRLRGSVVAFAVSEGYADHPITSHLMHHRTLWSDAREVRAAPRPRVKPTELVHTTDGGWGETNLAVFRAQAELQYDAATDVKGPISIGVASSSENGARLVVYGSAEIAGNRQVLGYNRDLLLSSVAWLLEQQPKIAIGPRSTEHLRLTLDDAQLRRVFWLCVLFIPLGALLLGGGVWWVRRS